MILFPMTKTIICGAIAASLALLPGTARAQGWRLVGITGQQQNETPDGVGGFLYPDNTLYEIDLATAAITKLFQTTWVPDSHAIGYCPDDGLLYHTAGSHSYSNNPLRLGHQQGGPDIPGVGYQDSQYFESIDLATLAATPIINAAPCPNPDASLPCFGLPAPRPDWLLPAEQRNSSQTDQSFRARGLDEYTAARGLAWSANRQLFYLADAEGIFLLDRDGICTFLARPAFPTGGALNESKAIVFVTVPGGGSHLIVGHRNGVGSDGLLMELDPELGTVVTEIALSYPDGGGAPFGDFGGLLGLAQHPQTGVLYGLRKTSDNFARELVTIDFATGATTLVGSMEMHFSSIAFVPGDAVPTPVLESVTHDGANVSLTWSGGAPPYQLQTSATLESDSWSDLGPATGETSATVPAAGPQAFFRVLAGR